jgi:hypothetical protein
MLHGWFVAVTALVAVAALAACGGHTGATRGGHAAAPARSPSTAVHAAITGPHPGALDVPTSTEIGVDSRNAARTSVTLTDETGQPVEGTMRPDGRSWVPARQLDWDTRYIAKLDAVGATGAPVSVTVTFTTMTQPDNMVMVRSRIGDGQRVGAGTGPRV